MSNMEGVKPRWAMLLMDTKGPKSVQSRTEALELKRDVPVVDSTEPRRVLHLAGELEPRPVESITGTKGPKRPSPNTNAADSIRAGRSSNQTLPPIAGKAALRNASDRAVESLSRR